MTGPGERIRAMRKERGLSQAALSGGALSASYISHIEAGRRQPTDEALRTIAEALGTTVSYLKFGTQSGHGERAQVELAFARLAMKNGDAAVALRQLESVNRSNVDAQVIVEIDLAIAQCLEMLGRLEESATLLLRLVRALQQRNSWVLYGTAATMLVGCYLEAGDLNRAVEVGDEAVTLLAHAGLRGTLEFVRLGSTIAWADLSRGDLLSAQLRINELLAIAEETGDSAAQGAAYWNAALVADERGRTQDALRLASQALALLAEDSSPRDLPRLRVLYAYLLLRDEPPQPEKAIIQLDMADDLLRDANSTVDLAYSLTERARAMHQLGDTGQARAVVTQALDLLGDEPRLASCSALIVLGDCLAESDVQAATARYQKAAARLSLMSATRAAASLWAELGDRFASQRRYAAASDAYQQALHTVGLRGRPSTIQVEVSSEA